MELARIRPGWYVRQNVTGLPKRYRRATGRDDFRIIVFHRDVTRLLANSNLGRRRICSEICVRLGSNVTGIRPTTKENGGTIEIFPSERSV